MKCSTPGCTNENRPGRKICTACKTRKHRAQHPLKYWFDTLKQNAKRRGKPFTLTLTEFECFCQRTGYDKLKGKTATSLSVDRKNDNEGYHAWNIQAITLSDNSKKKYDDSVKPDEYCPFD
jgi:hypothetical protein